MRHEHYILNKDHEIVEVSLMEWAEWLEDFEKKRVAVIDIGESRVSTVFLGLDHRFSGEGPPILFETLVFGGPMADEMDRYCTWDEAVKGHADMVKRVKEAVVAPTEGNTNGPAED